MRGDKFVDNVGNLLTRLGFKAYWPNEPIDIKRLNTSFTKPDKIEIDIIARLGSVGFLIEVTSQKTGNKEKIRKFLDKLRAFEKSKLKPVEIAKLFSGIPANETETFKHTEAWKGIYIGTGPEIIYKNIQPEDFGTTDKLKILNIDDWVYISKLIESIGEYAKYELISFLDIEKFLEKGYEEDVKKIKPFKVKNREITEINGKKLSADIYLFSTSPSFLLKVCKVPRFYGLPDREAKIYYQRMLNKNKLNQMRKNFIKNSPLKSFPTPITLILPPIVKETKKGEIEIPLKYGSLIVIDGQHRLYSYALLPDEVKKEAKILVTGIKFHSKDLKEVRRFSAKTFMEINREQLKVKTSLLYLIAYDAMGDTSDEALAGKVISLCNADPRSPLHDLFEGRALGRKSKLNIPRIGVVEVAKKLAKLIKKLKNKESKVFSNATELLNKNRIECTSKELIEVSKSLVDSYFKKVRKVFNDDWTKNTKSVLLRTKYIAAFILLLIDFLENEDTDFIKIEEDLNRLKNNIKNNSKWKRSSSSVPKKERKQIFHENRDGILPVKYSTEKIFESLKHYLVSNKTFEVKK